MMILVVLQSLKSLQGLFFFASPGIVSEKGVREEVPPVLQHQILQLALDLPASKFSWFRIQVKKLLWCFSPFRLAFWMTFVQVYCFVVDIVWYVFFSSLQDVADTESGEKSVLYLLLKMFVSSSSSHLKTSTRMLVLKVRSDLLFFCWRRLVLWDAWFCKCLLSGSNLASIQLPWGTAVSLLLIWDLFLLYFSLYFLRDECMK